MTTYDVRNAKFTIKLGAEIFEGFGPATIREHAANRSAFWHSGVINTEGTAVEETTAAALVEGERAR